VAIFSKSFFTLVRRHLVSFSFFTAWHNEYIICLVLCYKKNAPPQRECKGNTNFSKKEILFHLNLVLHFVNESFRRFEGRDVVCRDDDRGVF
jgi:hypothetical protein